MRCAIFGDIHANLHALQAVLADIQTQSCTHCVCLGDIVGYNAFPRECLEKVRHLDCPTVQGNHDQEASLNKRKQKFTPLAEQALCWTRAQLLESDKQWLQSLPLTQQVGDQQAGGFTIVHATLAAPEEWGYVLAPSDAAAHFYYQTTAVCFIGHTHAPRVYAQEPTPHALWSRKFHTLFLEEGTQYLINVGSVGQPRDGDWRSAYCIYDTDRRQVELRRLEYDLPAAQHAILQVGLPPQLARRLALGT